MYHDARTLNEDAILDCDIVVIGAGIAGLSFCHGLTHSTLKPRPRIILLESGDDAFIQLARQQHSAYQEPEPEVLVTAPQDFANQLNHGQACIHDAWGGQRDYHDFMHSSRCRGLGGSGRLWGGKLAPLDPIDFETRSWIEHSGWPFTYAEFKTYLDRACEVFHLPHFQTQAPVRDDDPRPPLIINRERNLSSGLRRYTAIAGRAQPQRFAEFIDTICQTPNTECFLHATALRLNSTQSGQVAALDCRASNGRRFQVHARHYILAAGGLENPRLLMHSRLSWPLQWRQHWQAAEEDDPWGAYFMGHCMHRQPNHAGITNQLFSQHALADWRLYWDKDPQQLHAILQLSAGAQRRARLPNFGMSLAAPTLSTEHAEQTTAFPVYFMAEQLPYNASRIRLLNPHEAATDALGLPRIRLDWRFQAADINALDRGAQLMAEELQRHRAETLRYHIEAHAVIHQIDIARHHLGTTRMHNDPRYGVVNAHAQLHGMNNVYCLGASLFPTSGIANPTLAIVALSLRSADYLLSSM